MSIDKSKLKIPRNTEDNREILADMMLHDMPIKELRRRVKEQLMLSYKRSTQDFLKEYWQYFEETYGHCPFGINSD